VAPVGPQAGEPSQTSTRTELSDFVARLVGWDDEVAVEHALRAVRLAASHQAALVLCGDGNLVPVARCLHRHVLGDQRPFVMCDQIRRATNGGAQLENRRTAADAVGAATGSTVCVRANRLPRDFAALVVAVRDARIQLVICGQQLPKLTELVLAPIKIPALATRAHELDRIIDEYAHDARVALRISAPLTDADRHWVRAHSATSLSEVEKGAWRMVALRHAGTVARAAELLGMTHSALGEWFGHRRPKHSPVRRAR
jgi:hypothetical protein